MNKISILFSILLYTVNASGQSQRLVLFEEFTGENCPPCAYFNPLLDQILDANISKVVTIKYQTDIPFGTPKLYDYNPSDVDAASFYYYNGGAPFGYLDGNSWTGPVGEFSQAIIDDRHAMPSPFVISATHSFSSAHDTVFIRAVITASQVVAGMTQLRAKIAVTEKEVTGFTAYNGETHFPHVMRKLLPDASGAPLPADWNTGDTLVIETYWRIEGGDPTPDWSQLEVVVFVQNDADREVMQAGVSPAFITTSAQPINFDSNLQLAVWPNPTVDFLTIHADFGIPKDVAVTITDIRGTSAMPDIRIAGTSSLNRQISVAMFPKGIYFLSITVNDQIIIRKVLIE
jgi:thiol-disulfide isomerase/thioredoxin